MKKKLPHRIFRSPDFGGGKWKLSWQIPLLAIVMLMASLDLSYGQASKVTGQVTSAEDGQPIPGATVLVKGTTNGTITDIEGNYSINVNDPNATLVFSYVGYLTEEISVSNRSVVDISLIVDITQLGEVVVTALGIERDKASLGYSVQEIEGASLAEAKEPNLANSLTGKVAGLQVIRSSNGPAGSSKIILRGYSSLSGDNQPLIVVDGIPVDNSAGAENNDYWNPSLDMGNGLADINANDIKSVSVLKGPSAAALYGSRAGNGVILITTKSGRKQDGLGITISSSVGFESIFTQPEMQDVFGQGDDGNFGERSTRSWGPKAEGQELENWNGETVPLSIYDNVGNYFDTGVRSSQNVSISQQFNKTSFYTSVNRLDDKSMIPGTELSRTSLTARAVSNFGNDDRWTTDTKIQYTNSKAENRPLGGTNANNPFYTLFTLPRSLDIRDFNPAVDEAGNMIWFTEDSQNNPYWINKYKLNQDIRDRFIMHGSVKYNFTDWLNAEIKGGADIYNTNTEAKLYAGGPESATGMYSNGKQSYSETNFSTLISAGKQDLFGRFGGTITVGGNLMSQKYSHINASSGELEVPNLFSLNNGVNSPSINENSTRKKINSVYGTMQLSWDGYLFVDATFRNDWSSALSKENRSYFYPSVGISYVFTDMFEKMDGNLPNWLSFGKLRASYAEVGNDLAPYSLYNTYEISKDPTGHTNASRRPVLYDENVLSELIKGIEVGAEFRFLQNRLGLDVAWYKSNATRQLIDLPMDPMSGYSSRKINAGDIQNKGIEIMVDATILSNPEAFSWNLAVNYSANKNTVEDIADDVMQYPIGGFDALKVLAIAGGNYGEIYGNRYLRVEDPESPYYGQKILDDLGLPQVDGDIVKLGDQQATGLLGITNSFSYKGLGLSFLIDARFGGEIFSASNVGMQYSGTAAATVVGGAREDFIVDGVVLDPDTDTFTENTTAVSPQHYWEAVTTRGGNLGIGEANIYDASNIRLRNVQVNYNFPEKIIDNTPFQRINVGVSCNNVWLISSHMNGIDPESVFATGTNAVGFENASPPTSRTILFNVTLGF